MNGKGILIVVSGFSGAGKGTLTKRLVQEHANYALSISATTRVPRSGEEDGKDYFFVAQDIFDQMVVAEAFLEYASYVNHSYGTPRNYVLEQMESGKDVILEIEIQGALKVKAAYPQAILVFITPPDAKELKRRLIGRGTESEAVIHARLQRAAEEADGMSQYDYILVNDSIEHCVAAMHQLVQSQHCRVENNLELVKAIGQDLKIFSE